MGVAQQERGDRIAFRQRVGTVAYAAREGVAETIKLVNGWAPAVALAKLPPGCCIAVASVAQDDECRSVTMGGANVTSDSPASVYL